MRGGSIGRGVNCGLGGRWIGGRTWGYRSLGIR